MFAGFQQRTQLAQQDWTSNQATQTAYALNFYETHWGVPLEVKHCVAKVLTPNDKGPVSFKVPAQLAASLQ